MPSARILSNCAASAYINEIAGVAGVCWCSRLLSQCHQVEVDPLPVRHRLGPAIIASEATPKDRPGGSAIAFCEPVRTKSRTPSVGLHLRPADSGHRVDQEQRPLVASGDHCRQGFEILDDSGRGLRMADGDRVIPAARQSLPELAGIVITAPGHLPDFDFPTTCDCHLGEPLGERPIDQGEDLALAHAVADRGLHQAGRRRCRDDDRRSVTNTCFEPGLESAIRS